MEIKNENISELYTRNLQTIGNKLKADLAEGNATDAPELKKSIGLGAKISNSNGQNIQQKNQIGRSQTDQSLVKVGGVNLKGKSTTGVSSGTDFRPKFRATDPGPDNPALSNKAAIAKAGMGIGRGLQTSETESQAIDRTALGISPQQQKANDRARDNLAKTGTTPGGVTKQSEKGQFNIFTLSGINRIFSRAGDLAAFFSSPEFLAEQRQARGAQQSQKNRIAELGSLDSGIKAISDALSSLELSNDEGTKNSLAKQLADMSSRRSQISSGTGVARRSADTSTAEGFAAAAKELGLTNDEIKNAATRRFAGTA